MLGALLGFVFIMMVKKITKRISKKQDHWFTRFQLFSAAMLSTTHGGNNVKKRWGSSSLFYLQQVY